MILVKPILILFHLLMFHWIHWMVPLILLHLLMFHWMVLLLILLLLMFHWIHWMVPLIILHLRYLWIHLLMVRLLILQLIAPLSLPNLLLFFLPIYFEFRLEPFSLNFLYIYLVFHFLYLPLQEYHRTPNPNILLIYV